MNLLIGSEEEEGGGGGRGEEGRRRGQSGSRGLDWNGWPLKQREKGGAQQPNGSTDATPTVSYF